MGLAVCLAGVYGLAAWQFHRASEISPDFSSRSTWWIAGPSGRALAEAAVLRIEEALRVLHDRNETGSARIERYRAGLRSAERLLERSLLAEPASARAIARLGAVRWELRAPDADDGSSGSHALLDLASRIAPDAPSVQVLLGELNLQIGRPDVAARRLRTAVELDPALAARAVASFRDHMIAARAILDALPRSVSVLIALKEPFFEDGTPDEYLDALEESLESGRLELLPAYAEASLRARRERRLLAGLDALDLSAAGPVDRALWSTQRSRGLLALGDAGAALDAALGARAIQPEDPRVLEQLGRAALATGDASAAVAAFRESLSAVARSADHPGWRARLYRQIGEAEEKRRNMARALDSYRKALALNPEDSAARRRIDEMESVPLPTR